MVVRDLTFASVLLLGFSLSPASSQETLRAGIDGTFAPHAMPNLKGGLEGFNVELVEELGKQLGAKIQVDAVQFSGLVPGLQSGTYDFIAAPVTANAERANNLLFSEGYVNTDFQLLLPQSTANLATLDELQGKVLAVNKGSTYDQWAREQAPKRGWKVESYGTSVDAIQAVLSGRAFGMLTGSTSAAWIVKQNPNLKLSLVNSTGLVFAFPVRKDNLKLRERIDLALECMKRDGVIARLHEKWFGVAPASDSASVRSFPGLGVPDQPGFDATPHQMMCR